jgi:hypothetical protein
MAYEKTVHGVYPVKGEYLVDPGRTLRIVDFYFVNAPEKAVRLLYFDGRGRLADKTRAPIHFRLYVGKDNKPIRFRITGFFEDSDICELMMAAWIEYNVPSQELEEVPISIWFKLQEIWERSRRVLTLGCSRTFRRWLDHWTVPQQTETTD